MHYHLGQLINTPPTRFTDYDDCRCPVAVSRCEDRQLFPLSPEHWLPRIRVGTAQVTAAVLLRQQCRGYGAGGMPADAISRRDGNRAGCGATGGVERHTR